MKLKQQIQATRRDLRTLEELLDNPQFNPAYVAIPLGHIEQNLAEVGTFVSLYLGESPSKPLDESTMNWKHRHETAAKEDSAVDDDLQASGEPALNNNEKQQQRLANLTAIKQDIQQWTEKNAPTLQNVASPTGKGTALSYMQWILKHCNPKSAITAKAKVETELYLHGADDIMG